uniref:Small ribosomal subunit protein uS3m n=1 Tax=Micractinium pusillum TaxID=126839 RepID=A0A650F3E4_9CHLO|nr:30S ribosomal protein S3 [Micractinium pusillum]
MGQKVNPVSLRLQYTNRNFDNCWYSNYFYKNLINKDVVLQHYFNNFLKLLKLPTGRYSIQHLQKKTQVYNFFCYSKSTREWRSKLFGLAQKRNFLKKSRYFFKNKTQFKKIRKKHTKFHYFYKTLNQLAVHKIQKKITSFQNFRLWSALQKTTYSNGSSLSTSSQSSYQLENLSGYLSPNFFLQTSNFLINQTKIDQQSLSIQKINQPNLNTKKEITNQKDRGNFLEKKLPHNVLSLERKEKPYDFSEIKDNSSLVFLQNLFVYKTLKSFFKTKAGASSKNFSNLGQTRFMNSPENRKILFNTLDSKYKNYLESSLSSVYNLELDYSPFRVKNDWQHANYLADEIAYFLEKRIPFRRLKNKILKQLAKISTIRGVRITCSGRVGGKSKKAQRSKTECLKYGQTSLQVFSSKIDFSMKTAFTSFGSVGVKVWICYY